jgi:hypothetical protein
MAQSWDRTEALSRWAVASATVDFPVPWTPVTTTNMGAPAMVSTAAVTPTEWSAPGVEARRCHHPLGVTPIPRP